jgi:membrane-bound serine protease (ClpP class)
MDLRASLLSLVGTPDRAWFTLLVGVLLVTRELSAPGRVLPGILGGVAVLTAANALTEYRLTLQGITMLGAGIGLVVLQGFRRWQYVPGAAAAGAIAGGARLLLAPPWQISWRAAAAGAVVAAICAALFRVAVRARRRKHSLE